MLENKLGAKGTVLSTHLFSQADSVFNGASTPEEEEVTELTVALTNATRTTEGVAALFPMELNAVNNIAGNIVEFLVENVATSTSLNTVSSHNNE